MQNHVILSVEERDTFGVLFFEENLKFLFGGYCCLDLKKHQKDLQLIWRKIRQS